MLRYRHNGVENHFLYVLSKSIYLFKLADQKDLLKLLECYSKLKHFYFEILETLDNKNHQ